MNEYYEARSFTHMNNKNMIYVISWGPHDDGKTISRPKRTSENALKYGVRNGRNGLGSLYVIAAGNGANLGDNCNYDGYVNSPYTLAIGSITNRNVKANYSEACSAIIAVTYSGGGDDEIHTTDVKNGCTNRHTGTSASAPIASGIISLMLNARPDLSWRDVQYVIVDNAKKVDLDNGMWVYNAAGKSYSNMYGFGALDAYTLVNASMKHIKVPEAIDSVSLYSENNFQHRMKDDNGINVVYSEISVSEEQTGGIESIESVYVTLLYDYPARGQLTIDLIGPKGSVSNLSLPRSRDTSKNGFRGWTFSSLLHWGESPVGTWRLAIKNAERNASDKSVFKPRLLWKLTIHGTCKPEHAALVNNKLVCSRVFAGGAP